MKKVVVLLGASILVPAALSGQDRCEFRDDVEVSLEAPEELVIEAGSGFLDVRGEQGATEVTVTATFCASDRERLEALDVEVESGSVARVHTEYPDWNGGWGDNYARIDLTIVVPAGTDLEIDDGSGGIDLVDVGHVRLEDGSGSVYIEGAESVVLDDGSGGVTVVDVRGDVRVEDGSGEIEIRGVGGEVVVDDGSGSIDIESVGGSVFVEEMGSGRLTVDDVDGDLVVDDGRRERIRHSNVRGELDLPAPRRRRG